VFAGKQCNCPKGKFASEDCVVDTATCEGYSAYENAVCKGWGEDIDYDRGHLAASSDTFDDDEAENHCGKVDAKGPLKWGDPYEDGFVETEWHRGDYSKCAWTASFLMTNVVPQGSLMNQVCWADIEIALKEYSEGKVDVFVAIGNSRAGTMRGQKTKLEDGYDAASADMVLIPHYQWKVACTYTGVAGASKDWKPSACTAWLVANRNLAVPEGCRTPMTLRQLKFLLGDLNELAGDGSIPGVPADWESTNLLPELKVACNNKYKPEYCNTEVPWADTSEDDNLVASGDDGPLQLSCESGASCLESCRCCDEVLIKKLKSALVNGA